MNHCTRAKAEGPDAACIFVDEAQFLTRAQAWQLSDVVDDLRIPVLCYGLRTDFRGELFEGSQYLLAWADELRDQAGREALGGEAAHEESASSFESESEPVRETRTEDMADRLKMVASSEPLTGAQAAAAKKPKPAKAGGVKNVFVDASHEQLQFLERVVQQLQEAGAHNLRIDYGTDRWMVLTVESK